MRPRLRALSPPLGARSRRVARALMLAVGLLASARAEAAPGSALDWRFPEASPPPFDQAELEAAVAIRQPPEAASSEPVALAWAGDGIVEASTRLRRRVVSLGTARGAEAARLVALAVVDVLRPLGLPAPSDAVTATRSDPPATATTAAAPEDTSVTLARQTPETAPPVAISSTPAAPTPASSTPASSTPAAPTPASSTPASSTPAATASTRAAVPAPANETLTFSLVGAVNRGVTSAGFALEPTAGAAWRLGGAATAVHTGVTAEIGYGQGRGRADGRTLLVHLAPVRLGLFLRRGGWAIAAGGLARFYATDGIAGGVARVQGWLLGGHAGVQRTSHLAGGLGLLVAAGVDVAANQVDFRVRGQSLLRTGRIVPAVRMGLAWRAR